MEYISAKIPQLALNLSTQLLNRVFESNVRNVNDLDRVINDDLMTVLLQDYALSSSSKPVELSFTRPDYEGIKLQLIAKLRESAAWKDIIQAGGGETLLEFISAIGAYAQLSIQRSLQESMLDTARLKSSIYTITRMLGVHIRRKMPSYTTAELVNNSENKYMLVPRYSQFSINGIKFFNREAITFTPQQPTQMVTLYQGEVVIEEMISTGRPFQRIEIGDSDFSLSDTDILCIDSNFNSYDKVEDGLWHYPGDKTVFYENTTPNGNVECLFGNNIYGKIPPIGDKLQFIYVKTAGDEHNTTATELAVNIVAVNDIVPERVRRSTPEEELSERNRISASVRGVCKSPIEGGSQENDNEFYRALAPHIYAAKDRMVTRKDHHALALNAPNIPMVDVYFQGQQELAPNNRNYINVVGVTTLKRNGEPLNDLEWKAFIAYLEEKAIWRCQYVRYDPTPIDIDIEATVYCGTGSDPAKVRTYIEYKLTEQFKLKRGTLGYSIYLSDIYDILEASHHSLMVDYAELSEPNNDIVISKTEFIRLRNVKINVKYTDRYYSSFTPNRPRGLPKSS